MPDPLVSVIVVTSLKNDYILRCLDSLGRQTCKDIEIIVVDNSLDRLMEEKIKVRYPFVNFYTPDKDLYYCQAVNTGIDESRGEFILCLNDDAFLENNFVEEALKGFYLDSRVGMVSGKVLRLDRKTIDSTGLFLSVYRTAKERGYGRLDKGQYDSGRYIFGVTGAVSFYRKAMLDEIKIDSEYFNSKFRFFYEDLDMAWRAQRHGWRGYYMPNALAYHLRGGTARIEKGINKGYARHYLNDDLLIDLIKNRYLTIIGNERFSIFFLHLPFIILHDVFSWLYIILFRPRLIKRILSESIQMRPAFMQRSALKNNSG